MTYNRFVTGADSKYFNEYGVSFATSCIKNRIPFDIEVVNPDDQSKKIIAGIWDTAFQEDFQDKVGINTSEWQLDNLDDDQKKVFYSLVRFGAAYRLGRSYLGELPPFSMFITDIDIIVNTPIEFPNAKYAFYMREEEPHPGMKLLASCFIRSDGIEYLSKVLTDIFSNPQENLYWFVDQVFLYKHLTPEIRNELIDIKNLNVFTWDFDRDTNASIMYPKGPRKSHPKYKVEKQKLEKMFWTCERL